MVEIAPPSSRLRIEGLPGVYFGILWKNLTGGFEILFRLRRALPERLLKPLPEVFTVEGEGGLVYFIERIPEGVPLCRMGRKEAVEVLQRLASWYLEARDICGFSFTFPREKLERFLMWNGFYFSLSGWEFAGYVDGERDLLHEVERIAGSCKASTDS